MAISVGLTRPRPPATVVNVVNSVTAEMYNTDVMATKKFFTSSHTLFMTIAESVSEEIQAR